MKQMIRLPGWIGVLLLAGWPASLVSQPKVSSPSVIQSNMEVNMTLQLTSEAFSNGQPIPAKHTCVGHNISPALAWTNPPKNTKSFTLIVDDPDAPHGTFVHWVLFNIPADTHNLPENLLAHGENGMQAGKNSYNVTKYRGPCPPNGTHRYFFKLYALDTVLNVPHGASKEQLLEAMNGHILAQTELMGTFHK